MISQIIESDKCTGCSACLNVCECDAITMREDNMGFLRPNIDASRCIECNRCKELCPVINPKYSNNIKPKCYAVMAEDKIREKSSSGGIFTVLAENILSNDGIVCGASLNKDLSVSHICIDKLQDLHKLQKSKYMQSIVSGVYTEIKNYLELGKNVLFVGCPCQVAGLKNYLEKDYTNLLTVDLFCHGVASYKMFKESMNENYPVEKITNLSFRNKDLGWNYNEKLDRWATSAQLLKFQIEDKEYLVDLEDSMYEVGFHQNISLQEACYNCTFSTFPRQGDISLGDYWGIENYDPNLTDNLGTSLVTLNNEKGTRIFKECLDNFVVCKETPMESICNRASSELTKNPVRDRFLSLYKLNSFNKSIRMSRDDIYDIGIVGLWFVKNHGSQLTYFALYHVIKSLGLSPLLISQPMTSVWKPETEPVQFFSNPYEQSEISKIYFDKYAMRELNDKCDRFLLGSDQLWNMGVYNITGRYASMEWVMANKYKIAYAASFGHDTALGSDKDNAELAYYLKKFDAISVREENAVKLAYDKYGIETECVLDPIFLCDRVEFDKLAEKGIERIPKDNFMFAYILDPNEDKQAAILKISNDYGYQIRVAIDGCNDAKESKKYWSLEVMEEVYNEEWLAMIKNAEVVITDSFHGMCFAILYHKPFIAIVNNKRGYERFRSFVSLVHLEKCLATNSQDIVNGKVKLNKINYNEVDTIINNEKLKSLKWLKNAIFSKDSTKKELDTFDIVDSRCSNIDMKYSEEFSKLVNEKNAEINSIYEYMKIMEINSGHQKQELLNKIASLNTELTESKQMIDNLQQELRNRILTEDEVIDYLRKNLEQINDFITNNRESIERQTKKLYDSNFKRFWLYIPKKLFNIGKCIRNIGIANTIKLVIDKKIMRKK